MRKYINKIYLGTFFISLSSLAFEITLTRLLSVIAWYYLAFFAVSAALLGMTAGAVTVYLKPEWFNEKKLNLNIAVACIGFSLSIPVSLIILCIIPFVLTLSVMSLFAIFIGTFACTLPFYFSGIAISAVITKQKYPIGKLYASDLTGASMGCLLVLGGLEVFDAPSLILMCSAFGVLSAYCFVLDASHIKLKRYLKVYLVFIVFIAVLNSFSIYSIRPFIVKGRIEQFTNHVYEKWNTFSRVVVYKMEEGLPQYWGPSPKINREEKIQHYYMNIDGDAGTSLRKFSSIKDIAHLKKDVTNAAYYISSKDSACIIGVGGARDVQSAVLFGQKKITGIEINPVFIDLLKGKFKEFAGVAKRKEISLIKDEARSYLSRSKEKYSVIQMSLTDTWASTGAGAYSLSENTLYTREAWGIFYDHLSDDGIFTVSRWCNPHNLGETGRIVSLASAVLLGRGTKKPSLHIAMVNSGLISTLIISKSQFSEKKVLKLKKTCEALKYDLIIAPCQKTKNKLLGELINVNSLNELYKKIKDKPYNYIPPTDENPYFFNMLKLNHLEVILWPNTIVGRGNCIANLMLAVLIISLFLLALFTIILPLRIKERQKNKTPDRSNKWPYAMYFSLIGAGFMFCEIALIQRLSVFLGHPVYALGILLFSIILSAGMGSLISQELPLIRKPWIYIYPLLTALSIFSVRFIFPVISRNMVSFTILYKITASLFLIIPAGIFMGMCFPAGMRLANLKSYSETPWFFALNGIFGVLSSALTVFVSIYFGISISFYIAGGCYLLLLFFIPYMLNNRAQKAEVRE